jgi:CheY-like chemotaxis protein/HPt (histidine-containing phosphotransfer) domain-containing protein
VGAILTKPVTSSMLFDAVNTSVALRGGTLPVWDRGEVRDASLDGLRARVVDDSDINLEVARRILESAGATVRVCANGQLAVEALAREPDGFDVVLMDVQMPVMDGNTATFMIRNELRLGVPIIALTAGALVAERQRSFDAGMTDFLSKPLDPPLLLRTVLRHVTHVRRAPRQSPSAASTARPTWPMIEGIDSADVSARLGHDVDLFASMLTFLVDEVDELLAGPAPDPADPELPARLHKLKGSAATLGAKALRAAAAEAEAGLKRGDGEAESAARLGELLTLARSLGCGARAFLDGRAVARPAPVRSAMLDDDEVQELYHLLLQQDVAALDQFHALADALRAACGDAFDGLEEAIEHFELERAAELMRAARLITIPRAS